MPAFLRRLMKAVNYIEYAADGEGNQLFWHRLVDALITVETDTEHEDECLRIQSDHEEEEDVRLITA